MIKIAITGHRHLLDEKLISQQIEATIRNILKEKKVSVFEAYTSLAIGTDSIFAQVVESKFKATIIPVLPYDIKEYEAEFENTKKQELNYWINKYIPVVLITNTPSPITEEWKEKAYYDCGKYLVDNCDVLISVWDKQPPLGHGGTAEIVAYADSKNKEYRVIKAKKDSTVTLLDKILIKQSEYDTTAQKMNFLRKMFWISSVVLAFAAACCFAVWQTFHFESDCISLQLLISEVSSIIIAIFISYKFLGKIKNTLYLEQRLKTEKLRLQEVFYLAGLFIPYDPKVKKQDAELKDLADEIDTEIKARKYHSLKFTEFTIKSLVCNQFKYHHDRIRKKICCYPKVFEWALKLIVFAFLINVVLHLINECFIFYGRDLNFHYPYEYSIFFSIFFPAFYAALEAIRILFQWEQLKEQSIFMLNYFSSLNSDFQTARQSNNFTPLLYEISKTMLTENEQWHTVIKNITAPPILY